MVIPGSFTCNGIGGAWSDGTTVYASTNGNDADSVISYPPAAIVGGNAAKTTAFSTTAIASVGKSNEQLVRLSNGYYDLAFGNQVAAFAPSEPPCPGTGRAVAICRRRLRPRSARRASCKADRSSLRPTKSGQVVGGTIT